MKTIIKIKQEDFPRFVTIKLGQKILQEKSERLLSEESFCGRYADVVLYRVSQLFVYLSCYIWLLYLKLFVYILGRNVRRHN